LDADMRGELLCVLSVILASLSLKICNCGPKEVPLRIKTRFKSDVVPRCQISLKTQYLLDQLQKVSKVKKNHFSSKPCVITRNFKDFQIRFETWLKQIEFISLEKKKTSSSNMFRRTCRLLVSNPFPRSFSPSPSPSSLIQNIWIQNIRRRIRIIISSNRNSERFEGHRNSPTSSSASQGSKTKS